MLPRIRQHVSVPVGVGFGIRVAQTQTVGQVADAVIIGSRIGDLLDNQPEEDRASGNRLSAWCAKGSRRIMHP